MADLSSYINIAANTVISNTTVSTTGNVTGNYILGNGSQLTGITGGSNYSNANVTSFLGTYGSNNISTSGNITAGNLIGNIQVTNSVTGTQSNVTLIASTQTWVFDNTGNLKLPGNALVTTSTGNLVLGSATATGSPGLSSTSSLTVTANRAGAAYSWVFGNDSNLTLAGSLIADGSSPSPVLQNFTFDNFGGNIINSGNAFVISAKYYPPTGYGYDVIVNGGNSNASSRTGGNVNINAGLGNSAANGNVRITSGPNTWIFDNTGNLSVAGTIIMPSGAALIGTNASPAPTIRGFDSATFANVVSVGGNVLTARVSASGNITGGNTLISGLISATGNIYANNFIGNISIVGNVQGTQANVTLVAGSYSYVFDNTGNVTLPTGGDLVFSGNTSLTSISNGNITIDPNGTGQLIVTATTPAKFGNTISATGTITSSGNTNATAFAVVGDGAASNVALGFFPTGNTAAEMAIRDYSTANSTMYFDTTVGSANVGGSFRFRGSNSFAVYANINSFGISTPNVPAFRVYGNGVTGGLNVTTNGNGVLNGNNWAVDYNQGSYLNLSNGVFTAPIAGLYQVNLVARCANNSAPASQVVVIKNFGSGNINQAFWETPANAGVNHFGVSTISKLAVGDTLVVRVTQGNISFDVNDNWSVAFLG
jgi:hypothetical protein